MAHIDKFIEVVFRYEAEKLVLDTDQRAALVAGEHVRHVTSQPTSHKQIQDLVQEILPEDTTRISSTETGREFDYSSPAGAVRVRVQRHALGTRVEVVPAGAGGASVAPEFGEARVPVAVSVDADQGRVTAIAAAPALGGAPASVAPAPVFAPTLDVVPRFGASAPRGRAKLDVLFEKMIEHRCSDLHMSVGSPPYFRRDGEMTTLGEATPLTADVLRELLLEITPAANAAEFQERHDTDFSYEMNEDARFRANLFLDRRGMGGVFRLIPGKIPTPQEIGLPKHILDLCGLRKGLVLVTGPTGSGKSTTLAAMIEHINRTRSAHIITIEDPIEFTYSNKKCLINQREVGAHTEGFKNALRAALREDPDIVLVGEMRDLETVAIALETAETGHLVFGTLHTNTAASSVDRMIDQFPADRQAQVRTMLAESLKGVVAQILVKRRTSGVVAAQEILIVNPAVSNLIREGKTFQIQSIIQTGRGQGMIAMSDALLELVRSNVIDPETALDKAPNRAEFKALLERVGTRPAATPGVATARS